jgi:hypothetical protein
MGNNLFDSLTLISALSPSLHYYSMDEVITLRMYHGARSVWEHQRLVGLIQPDNHFTGRLTAKVVQSRETAMPHSRRKDLRIAAQKKKRGDQG